LITLARVGTSARTTGSLGQQGDNVLWIGAESGAPLQRGNYQ
jgi:hypothetical protein